MNVYIPTFIHTYIHIRAYTYMLYIHFTYYIITYVRIDTSLMHLHFALTCIIPLQVLPSPPLILTQWQHYLIVQRQACRDTSEYNRWVVNTIQKVVHYYNIEKNKIDSTTIVQDTSSVESSKFRVLKFFQTFTIIF